MNNETNASQVPEIGDFAALKVVAIESVGAFLDCGLPKDLFLPFAEQTRRLEVGETVVVFLYIDNTERVSASMRVDRNAEKTQILKETNDAVDLLIVGQTDLGFKAIVDERYIGMLYGNEVFQPLQAGQRITGYIKKVRTDGKIDLQLNQAGHRGADPIAERLLELLNENSGFLPITDKTPPDTIYESFGVSKKKFKIALGGLYKKRQVRIETEGIRLIT